MNMIDRLDFFFICDLCKYFFVPLQAYRDDSGVIVIPLPAHNRRYFPFAIYGPLWWSKSINQPDVYICTGVLVYQKLMLPSTLRQCVSRGAKVLLQDIHLKFHNISGKAKSNFSKPLTSRNLCVFGVKYQVKPTEQSVYLQV